jgi:hypothetical protein
VSLAVKRSNYFVEGDWEGHRFSREESTDFIDAARGEIHYDRLQWRRVLGVPKERRYVRVAGVSPDVEIKPFINNLDTLLRGVL